MENSYKTSVPKNGGQEMRREDHVRVRLGHASSGNTVQVRLTTEEKEVLAEAAELLGYERGLSTFLRQLGLEAAAGFTGVAEDRITAAAGEVGMAAGEWLRTIALAAIKYTPLRAQIELAWEAYRAEGRLPHNATEIERDERDVGEASERRTAASAKRKAASKRGKKR